MILLVVELCLRVTDVSELRLNSLKWERNELELIQHKTGNRATHPLLEMVKNRQFVNTEVCLRIFVMALLKKKGPWAAYTTQKQRFCGISPALRSILIAPRIP